MLRDVFLLLQMRLWLTKDIRKVQRTATESLMAQNMQFSQPAFAFTPMLLVFTDSTVCEETVLCASET